MNMRAHVIDAKNTRDLSPDVIGADGRLKIMPADYYLYTTPQERGLLGHRYGLYCLPTVELVERLQDFIGGREAIEIGAGSGVLAEAVGIHATDSKLQEHPAIKEYYAAGMQPVVKYGPNVEGLDARHAVRKYRPEVVVAAWVTHRYNEREHERGGNMYGVDEQDVLDHCKYYVFVGNAAVHHQKPIAKVKPELLETPDWLYSRAQNGSPDFIAVWRGRK